MKRRSSSRLPRRKYTRKSPVRRRSTARKSPARRRNTPRKSPRKNYGKGSRTKTRKTSNRTSTRATKRTSKRYQNYSPSPAPYYAPSPAPYNQPSFANNAYKGHGRYKAKSPNRRRGQYAEGNQDKMISWLGYMIENNAFGTGTVCNAITILKYNMDRLNFMQGEHSLFYSIVACPYKMVVIDLHVFFDEGAGHANLLLINKSVTPWEIERFEPHGNFVPYSMGMNKMQQQIDGILENWLEKNLKPFHNEFIYKTPMNVCPRLGPQSRAEQNSPVKGLCQTWTWFYLDARLSNPSLTGTQILEELYSIDPNELTELIQDYVFYIRDTFVPEEYVHFRRKLEEATKLLDNTFMNLYNQIELSPNNIRKWVKTIYDLLANTKTKNEVSALETFIKLTTEHIFNENIDKFTEIAYKIAGKRIDERQMVAFFMMTFGNYLRDKSDGNFKAVLDYIRTNFS